MTPESMAHLDLPAGSYLTTASFWLSPEGGIHNSPVFCFLTDEGGWPDFARVGMMVGAHVQDSISALAGALTLVHTVAPSGGRVDLNCYVNSLYEDTVLMIRDIRLDAVQVGSVTTQ
jgi:hypothetical protein